MKVFNSAAILLVAASFSAGAATIDFQDLASGTCASLGVGTITSGGYNFTGNPVDPNMFSCNPGIVANNTTQGLINANSLSIITMTQVGGGAFALNSFFAGTRFINHGYGQATGIDVVADLFGGGTASTSFNFTAESFDQFSLSAAFGDVVSVTFTSIPGTGTVEFLIDDIVVNSRNNAPEPGTLALLGLGIIAAGLARKRKPR